MNEATEHAWNFQRERPHVRPRAQVTVAGPYSGTLEGLITRFRWHLTALREWCKRLGMAQQGEEYDPRIPPDVPLPRVDPKKVTVSGHGHDFGGKDNKRRTAIIDTLLIAGIIALVSTSVYLLKTTVKLETSYNERGQLYDERFGQIREDNQRQDREISGHDQRLDRLDQQSRRLDHRHTDDQ